MSTPNRSYAKPPDSTYRPMGERDGTVSSICRVCGTRIEYRCTVWEPNKPSEWQGYCPNCEANPTNNYGYPEGQP